MTPSAAMASVRRLRSRRRILVMSMSGFLSSPSARGTLALVPSAHSFGGHGTVIVIVQQNRNLRKLGPKRPELVTSSGRAVTYSQQACGDLRADRDRGNDGPMLPRRELAPHAIAQWARDSPDQVAVIRVDSGAALTYRDLHEQALCWAAAYQRLGVRAGTHVATMIPDSAEAYIA